MYLRWSLCALYLLGYHTRLTSLLPCLCDVFRALIKPLYSVVFADLWFLLYGPVSPLPGTLLAAASFSACLLQCPLAHHLGSEP